MKRGGAKHGAEAFPFLLADVLRDKGWSRGELARRLGLNVGYVSRLVSGEVLPGWDAAVRIALVLQVPLADLAPRPVRPLLAGFRPDEMDGKPKGRRSSSESG